LIPVGNDRQVSGGRSRSSEGGRYGRAGIASGIFTAGMVIVSGQIK
jgi:hypothetical protein